MTFYPTEGKKWRAWLQKNHENESSVWLIFYKKKSGKPSISWSEAVDEALCFGWIDSKAKPIDEEKYMQFFSKRKVGSTWSKVNKDKVVKLMEEAKMFPAGLASIEDAKRNGSWTILDKVEAFIIPEDLEREFKLRQGSKAFFLGLSKSVRKSSLQWIVLAKRDETRQKRVCEIAELASVGRKPKHL